MRNMLVNSTLIAGMLPLLLAACTTSSAAGASDQRTVADGQEFTLAVGERVVLTDSSSLRYVRVIADSRCPPGAQCVWAGDAELELEWTPGAGPGETFSLHTNMGDKSRNVGNRRLTLESLAQGDNPAAQLRLDAIP